MDPTHKKHPKPITVKPHRHHLLPDPTIVPPPSTIQNISHRFSKLYANHKKLVGNSLKPPNVNGFSHPTPHPEPDTDLQTKTLSLTTLTKSNSHHERKVNLDLVKFVNVTDNDEIKKPSFKKNPKNPSLEENDVKKASQVMCNSLEREKLKRFGEGIEVKDNDEIKKPSLKKDLKIPSFQEYDVKKASKLSLESEKMKGFEERVEVKRLSVSSIPPMVNGRRRKSFCSSQSELTDFFSCTGVKVVAVDMPPFMQIHAVDCARKAHDSLEKFTSRTLALKLKKEFDGVYGPAWHCIVGTSFGSFVTHSVGGFMYFSMDYKLYILLFKTTVQKAD